jgi:uncharacterized Zn finger protein (UPF0148 family)
MLFTDETTSRKHQVMVFTYLNSSFVGPSQGDVFIDSCPFCNRENFTIKYTAPAVMSISSIYLEKEEESINKTEELHHRPHQHQTKSNSNGQLSMMSQHFASVEDRQRLQEDLRSQLNITNQPSFDQPLPPPVPPRNTNTTFYMNAMEAARMEELMLLEAIRRSMRDVQLEDMKRRTSAAETHEEEEEEEEEENKEKEDEEENVEEHFHPSVVGSGDMSFQPPEPRHERLSSSNPFDVYAINEHTTQQLSSTSSTTTRHSHWNPFND